MDLDNLDIYCGDTEHDMWVDFDSYENTGEPDVFSAPDIDEFINNLSDWD